MVFLYLPRCDVEIYVFDFADVVAFDADYFFSIKFVCTYQKYHLKNTPINNLNRGYITFDFQKGI
jgi:hypothetical protein